jgi:NAD(P)H-hydrate epimerase
MIGGLLAQYPDAPLGVASAAVLWHGLAADALARARGAAAVRTTELLDHLSDALRAGLEP